VLPPIKKVIRAGAGAGKTYRLSLEYIGLLLNYSRAGLHFSEILVITFTKKATAEIRERIFEQLAAVIARTPEGLEITRNLELYFNIAITERERESLRRIYSEMLMNKHQVQISTIDSFTNTIFKTIIAPYLGISDYTIRDKIDDDVQDELYRSVLEDEQKLDIFRSFFLRSRFKKIQDYEAFFKSVIDKRWVFHLIDLAECDRPFAAVSAEKIREAFALFREKFSDLFSQMQAHALAKDAQKMPKNVLQTNFYDALESVQPHFQFDEIHQAALRLVNDPRYLEKYLDLLLDGKNLWYYHKIFSKKVESEQKEHYQQLQAEVRQLLADAVFYQDVLNEERDLFQIIRHILARYDELKFRDSVFTYSDITYYTFKYLYDPGLSLIEDDYVANSFYEHLSSNIRFMLIDEFQDTSIIQYKILLPIIREVISGAGVKEYGGVIVVGDEKQSIYGWRGGERDLLLNMPETLQGAEQITLDTSYRSDEKIITFINTVFASPELHRTLNENGITWPYSPLRAHKQNNSGCVQLFLRNFGSGKESSNNIKSEDEAIREFLQQTMLPLLREQHISVANTAILARTNAELSAIAAALDELGIKYVQESSFSILDHRAVKPIYLLLQFLLYGDFYELLKFLRSDLVMLDTKTLKDLLLAFRDSQERWDVQALLRPFSQLSAIKKILELLKLKKDLTDLFLLTQKTMETFNLPGHFSLESDMKNIHQFLILIADFQLNAHDYPNSLQGFLDYCRTEQDRENFRQVSLEETNAISLMTIHKSKGLEFDHVFLYWNLSGGKGAGYRELKNYLVYEKDFSAVQSNLLTFNYDHIVPISSFKEFADATQRRELMEELNTLYVALTRAKSNLFIGFTYKKSAGYDAFLKDHTDLKIRLLLADSIRAFFRQTGTLTTFSDHREQGVFGEIPRIAEKKVTLVDGDLPAPEFFDADYRKYLEQAAEPRTSAGYAEMKSVFIEQNSIAIGNAVHYYLSFIRHGSENEIKTARQKTISFYGTLIQPEELSAIFQILQEFVKKRSDIFSTQWTRVFTEHTLFAPDGREVRVDRMMVNEPQKLIEIIDYKTGHIFEPEQIELYIAAVEALPFIQRQGYKVAGRFVEIKLN
jgi:ATP-dependent exoDNAse (exonuclease V) beta subunit